MIWPKKYDVFISYAIEDKETVAQAIASDLENFGLRVYYVGRELQVGDEISEVISIGLKNSSYFIMVLSPFYKRKWTIVEGHRFIQKEKDENKKLIFPVWHNIDLEEAQLQYPELADRYAITTNEGLDLVTSNLNAAIREKKKRDLLKRLLKVSGFVGLMAFILFSVFPYYQKYSPPAASKTVSQRMKNDIQKRISACEIKTKTALLNKISQEKGSVVGIDSIIRMYNYFMRLGKREEDVYSFTNKNQMYSDSSQIVSLGIKLSHIPYTYEGMLSLKSYCLPTRKHLSKDTSFCFSFVITNEAPVQFETNITSRSNDTTYVHAIYTNYIRSIYARLSYSKKTGTRRQEVNFSGYMPAEEYVFQKHNLSWALMEER